MIPSSHISIFSQTCPVDHSGTAVQISGWKCDEGAQAPVICLHDLGESASIYRGALELLAANGGSAFGFDMRGHGRGRPGAISAGSIRTFQRDLLQVVALVKHQESGKAPVLLVNGLSSVLALRLALGYPKLVSGLILVDPPHPAATSVSRLRHGATRFLAEVMPDVELPAKVLSAKRILKPQVAAAMAPAAAHELVESVALIPDQLAKLSGLSIKCLVISSNPATEVLWREEIESRAGRVDDCEVVGSPVGTGSLPVHIISQWLRT
jgi:pimeloyl-ACP methyl ester carboxylesterase